MLLAHHHYRHASIGIKYIDFIERQSKGQYGPSANFFVHQDPSGVSELSQSQCSKSAIAQMASEVELSAQTLRAPCAAMVLEGGLLKSGGSAVWRAQAVAHLCMDAGTYAARQAP